MKKVILWGMGLEYETLLNVINFEIYKGNMQVVAVICRKEDKYCSKRDGFYVADRYEIGQLDFDYIIITAPYFFDEIKHEAIELGIDSKRIINGEIFHQPLFDFKRYAALIENPVTILSDDCWGGMVYHRLNLEFSSPLINIRWDAKEFVKFVQKPLFYLGTELTMERESDFTKCECPIGRLGNDGDYVFLKLAHYCDFKDAKKAWDRRVKRINRDNLFVKIAVFKSMKESDIDLCIEAYKKLDVKKTFFLFSDDVIIPGQVSDKKFALRRDGACSFDYGGYMCHNSFLSIDLLKMLNGEDAYLRY